MPSIPIIAVYYKKNLNHNFIQPKKVEQQSSAVGVTSQSEREPYFHTAKTRDPFLRANRLRCPNGRGLPFYFLVWIKRGQVSFTERYGSNESFRKCNTARVRRIAREYQRANDAKKTSATLLSLALPLPDAKLILKFLQRNRDALHPLVNNSSETRELAISDSATNVMQPVSGKSNRFPHDGQRLRTC